MQTFRLILTMAIVTVNMFGIWAGSYLYWHTGEITNAVAIIVSGLTAILLITQ